jgi:Rod binding domain-containing protein
MESLVSFPPSADNTGKIGNSPERISKAARDFETILLRSLLEPMQKSFSKICSDGDQAGQEDYQYMGSEALASALAASGGLGISQLITQQLTRAQQKNEKLP